MPPICACNERGRGTTAPRRALLRPPTVGTVLTDLAPITVQIFGFNDCQETRKALRFFSERRIPVHVVDLEERPASRGELDRFAQRFGAAALINRESPRFRALGLHVSGDSPERLVKRALVEPRLLRTPLVRNGNRLTIGPAPVEWRAWAQSETKGQSA